MAIDAFASLLLDAPHGRTCERGSRPPFPITASADFFKAIRAASKVEDLAKLLP